MKNLSLTFCLAIAALFGSVGSGFASDLPPCPSSGYFDNCSGTFIWSDGTKYVGEWKDDNKHGKGTYTDIDGITKKGIWQNGNYQEKPYPTLRKFFLDLPKDEREQLQTKLKNLDFYKSSIDGLYGKFTETALLSFNNQYLDGTRHLDYIANAYYTNYAYFRNLVTWILELQVEPTFSDFTSNLPRCSSNQTKKYHECFGSYTFENGDKYIGEWFDHQPSGTGLYTYAERTEWEGDHFFGEYLDGKRNGKGTEINAFGYKYIGEYKNNKRHGTGTYTFQDDGTYETIYFGQWENGKINGHGTIILDSATRYEGKFENGNFNGTHFLTNKFTGYGLNVTGLNKPDEVILRDDIIFNKFTNIPFTGRLSSGGGGFINGKKEGLWLEIRPALFLGSCGHGPIPDWCQNGRFVGHYKDGKKDGVWKEFNENSYLRLKETYKNGTLIK